jgi:zinc protease
LEPSAPDLPFRQAPPAVIGDALPKLKFQSSTLPNGMTIVVVERPELPVAAISWGSRAAHDDGTQSGAGLAWLVGDAVAERVDDARERLEERGLLVGPGVTVSRVGTSFQFTTLSPAWKAAVDELAGMVRSPIFSPAAMANARRRRANSMQSSSLGVLAKIHKTADEGVWGPGSPAALSIDGAGRQTHEFSDAEVRAFWRRTYRPKDSILVAVGPFAAGDVVTVARAAFASWADPKDAPTADVSETPPRLRGGDRTEIKGLRAKGLARASVAFACTGAEDENDIVFELISHLVMGFSSFGALQRLRVENSDTYYMHANCFERRAAGTYFVDIDSTPEELTGTLGALLDGLDRLRQTEVDSTELTAAAMRYLGGWQTRFSSGAKLAHSITSNFEEGLGPDHLATLEERARAVTPRQVLEVARRYMSPGQMIAVVFGDPALVDTGLEKLGTVTWSDSVEKTDIPSQIREEEQLQRQGQRER